MARIFITGSADRLGRGAASVLMGEGHDVVLHARTLQWAALSDLAPDASGVGRRPEPSSEGPQVLDGTVLAG